MRVPATPIQAPCRTKTRVMLLWFIPMALRMPISRMRGKPAATLLHLGPGLVDSLDGRDASALFTPSGIHLNEEGNRVVAELVMHCIRAKAQGAGS